MSCDRDTRPDDLALCSLALVLLCLGVLLSLPVVAMRGTVVIVDTGTP